MRIELFIIALVICCSLSSATLNPSKKKGKSKNSKNDVAEIKMNSGPVDLNIFDRQLVEMEPLASRIIEEANTYYKDTSIKNFNETVLAYVTPVS
jgi:hypothetical protein